MNGTGREPEEGEGSGCSFFCLFQLNTNERSEMRGLIERNKRHTGYFVLIE